MLLAFTVFTTDLIIDYLPKFSNTFLTTLTYFLIVMLPVSFGIYYNNKR
jgi:hypothetical protein